MDEDKGRRDMEPIKAMLRLHTWLEVPEGMILGLGRAELLMRIQETGSLNRAAQVMGMSYRAAWGRLKASEAIVGEPLVEKTQGNKGFVLTELGERLAKDFKAWHADVERYALERAQETFPWRVEPFQQKKVRNADG